MNNLLKVLILRSVKILLNGGVKVICLFVLWFIGIIGSDRYACLSSNI